MKRLNAAFGSNLNLEQMGVRCPSARIYKKGVIKGYKLLFRGGKTNAYATIEPSENSEVPVLVWEIQPEDEKALDRYEGYPRFYGKEDLSVELEDGERIKAMTYIMTEERTEYNMPSLRYLNTIKEGYKSLGFCMGVLEKALKDTVKRIEKDTFFTQHKCDRCGKDLKNGRIMSRLNTDCICIECSEKEKSEKDYKRAVERELEEIKKGNYNFKGIRE